jgi:hypothetical protein
MDDEFSDNELQIYYLLFLRRTLQQLDVYATKKRPVSWPLSQFIPDCC